MSDTDTFSKFKVEIDLAAPFLENAKKIIDAVTAWDNRTEDQKRNLSLGLSGMAEGLYREAWINAMIPLDRSGLGQDVIESIRLAILFGAWVEIVDTIKPEIFELVKKE